MRKFTGSFSQDKLETTIKEIILANNAEMYAELMYINKWLNLCMTSTDRVLEKYENGYDITGAKMVKGSEIWRSECLHFNQKKQRIQTAIDLCEKYVPFKEVA